MIPFTIPKSFSVRSQAASNSKSLTRKIDELVVVEPHAEPGDDRIALDS
jgi:hypothetical protein